MHYFNEHYWGMHLVWWIIWIGFVIWVLVSPSGKKISADKYLPFNGQTPLDILKKRYASGEITKEELLEAKDTLDLKE